MIFPEKNNFFIQKYKTNPKHNNLNKKDVMENIVSY